MHLGVVLTKYKFQELERETARQNPSQLGWGLQWPTLDAGARCVVLGSLIIDVFELDKWRWSS
jgi:hypothetical protein